MKENVESKFDVLLNFKNRQIVSEISLGELIESIKNPTPLHKKIIQSARENGKNSKDFEAVKSSIPCFIPNFRHNEYVKTSTIKNSTGFLYIDVDESLDIDFAQFEFVVASWKSLSGIGRGILVSVKDMDKKGTELETLNHLINTISNEMDIKHDKNAISRDRVNVISFDEDVYYNPNYVPIEIEVNIDSNLRHTVNYLNNNNRLREDVLIISDVEEALYGGELRFSNIEDFTSKYEFKDDEVYKDLEDDKIKYTHIFIPKTIPVGERNGRLYRILSGLRALNPHLTSDRLGALASVINKRNCYEPMETFELMALVGKIMKQEIALYPNKTKRFLYNSDYMLTTKQRRSIATTENNRKRAEKSAKELIQIIENWDFVKDGKLNLTNLSKKSNLTYRTITRKKATFLEKMQEKLAQMNLIA